MGIPGNQKKKLWKINGNSKLSEILVCSSPGPRTASRRTFQPQPSSESHSPAKWSCSQLQPVAPALGADGWMCERAEMTNSTTQFREKQREVFHFSHKRLPLECRETWDAFPAPQQVQNKINATLKGKGEGDELCFLPGKKCSLALGCFVSFWLPSEQGIELEQNHLL